MAVFEFHTLASIRIYHRFYLNVGEVMFEDLAESDRQRQLSRYRWQDFIAIRPLGNTPKLLKGHQMITQVSNTHFTLRVRRDPGAAQQPFIPISQDLTLVFGLFYQDVFFENYTDMSFLREHRMVWCNNLERHQISDGLFPFPVQDTDEFSSSFLASSSEVDSLCQRLGIPFPVGCKGLLLLSMQGQSGDFSILNGNGTIKQHPTEFYMNFSNRSTNWRYIKPELAFSAETEQVKPLTRDGYVTIDQQADFSGDPDWPGEFAFPNPDIRFLKHEDNKLISEIYL
jgi:hypothetical protein